MKTLGTIIVYLGLFLIFMATLGAGAGGIVWPGLILGALVALVGAGLGQAGAARVQSRKDDEARKAFETMDFSGKALFLRTFENDGHFSLARPDSNLFDWDQYDRPGEDSLERMLAEAFAPTCSLIGAGGKGGAQFGAGTAGMLDDWKPRISGAIATAGWIVLVPSANPGTLWEIGEILRLRALARTVFVMPPSVAPLVYSGPVALDVLWSRAREACLREFKLSLPPYDPQGAVFAYRGDGSGMRGMVRFDMRSPRKLTGAIDKVL